MHDTLRQGLHSLSVNEFPRFISENVKHSRVLFYFNNAILLKLINKTQESVAFFNYPTKIMSYRGFFFVFFCQNKTDAKGYFNNFTSTYSYKVHTADDALQGCRNRLLPALVNRFYSTTAIALPFPTVVPAPYSTIAYSGL